MYWLGWLTFRITYAGLLPSHRIENTSGDVVEDVVEHIMQLRLVLQESLDYLQALKRFVETVVSNHGNQEFPVLSADVDQEMERLRGNMTRINENFTTLIRNTNTVGQLYPVGALFSSQFFESFV